MKLNDKPIKYDELVQIFRNLKGEDVTEEKETNTAHAMMQEISTHISTIIPRQLEQTQTNNMSIKKTFTNQIQDPNTKTINNRLLVKLHPGRKNTNKL